MASNSNLIPPCGIGAAGHTFHDSKFPPYEYSYLSAYPVEVTGDTKSSTLPQNDKIRILAISTAEENPSLTPAQPLFNTLGHTESPREMESKLDD